MKKSIIYAFIDSQNLNLALRHNLYRKKKLKHRGWQLDYKKFRVHLKDKYKVSKAFLFIGFIEENKKLYTRLEMDGFTLVFKPTTKDLAGRPKGNVDVELVLHSAAVEFKNYTKAIIVSGDGDFHCLLEYLKRRNKLYKLFIPNEYSYSSLLLKFKYYTTFVNQARAKLEYSNKP